MNSDPRGGGEAPHLSSSSLSPRSEVQEDPYNRRLREASAQMDMSKSVVFLAVEELVKAQETHMLN